MKRLSDQFVIYTMSAKNPIAMTIESQEVILIETLDCYSNQICPGIKTEGQNFALINPATGPIWVQGAMPGDALVITIRDIVVANRGLAGAYPDSKIFPTATKQRSFEFFQIQHDQVSFLDVTLPIMPMIGVIGVAPQVGEVACATPGKHGGNMDCCKIRKGSQVFLPVYHPGALLALGDVHACMGDGEVMGSGLEIAATIELEVAVLKDQKLDEPWVLYDDVIYVIESGETMEIALAQCCQKMNQALRHRLHCNEAEAAILMSLSGNSEVCQIVNDKTTMRFGMPYSIWKGNRTQ